MTVHVIATGGTISSHFDGSDWTNIDGATLVAELGDLPVPVVVHDVAAGPSSNLSVDHMVSIAGRVQSALEAGARGVVVVHGTDTMELTAFLVQLLLGTSPTRRPVVFTGSMRVHSHALPDGPRNLRDAITVAASDDAVGSEVLVCMEGVLHTAARVTKQQAASVDAFHSHPFPACGSVLDGVVHLLDAPIPQPAGVGVRGPVPLFTSYPGVEAHSLEAVLEGAAGVVVEGFGDLNVPQALWAPIHHAWRRGQLVVLASRPFTPTAANDDLALLGAIGAGGLTAQKARLAAMVALGSYAHRDDAVAFMHRYALNWNAGDRSTTP